MQHNVGADVRWVVWDWNGTLLDDVAHCIDVINRLLDDEGLPAVDLVRYRELFDFPVRRYYERLGFDLTGDRWERLATQFIHSYDEGVHRCALFAGARALLENLQKRRINSSILSAARRASIEELLAHRGIRSLIGDVVGLDDHYAGGKAERALMWLAETGTDPSTMLLIGDTTHDYEVARAMGASCILVSGGHHPSEKLTSCGCPVVDTLDDIVV